jgi:hypothetical protein
MTITAPQVSHQCAPGGLFIGVVTHGHYNVCSPTLPYHRIVMGSLQSFVIYKFFPCPMNEDVTRDYYATSLDVGASSVLMTFGAALHYLEASGAEVTFGCSLHLCWESLHSIWANAPPCD